MPLSHNDLLFIVGEAATLIDRMGQGYIPTASRDEPTSQARFNQWRNTISSEDPAVFVTRLAWDGWTPEWIQARLGLVQLAPSEPLPQWAVFLQTMLAEVFSETASEIKPAFRPPYSFVLAETPVPFEDLFAPLVAYAWQQVVRRSDSSGERLADKAQIELQRTILNHVALMFWNVLNLELALSSSADDPDSQSEVPPERAAYSKFVGQIHADGFRALFHSYPVMAQLLSLMLMYWIDSTVDFIQRLAADWKEIEAQFNSGAALTQLASAKSHLSDRHNQHRTVISLTFDTGLRLIYKPKNFGLETAYSGLLRWLNEQGLSPEFKVLHVLGRQHYGWVEFAEHQPCADEAALRRFYYRSGMLLAILHILHTTDAHSENIIACGEYPVLIDTETLLTPVIRNAFEEEAQGETTEAESLHEEKHHTNSVLNTAFLPEWRLYPNGLVYDESGLGRRGSEEVRVPIWRHINTSLMALDFKPHTEGRSPNSPYLPSGTLPDLDYFMEDILAGFRSIYCFFMDRRDELLSPEPPAALAAFKNQAVRFIFRHTRTYGRVIDWASAPQRLVNGVDFSLTFEPLAKAPLLFTEKPLLWDILRHESAALHQLDVPYFSVQSTSSGITTSEGKVLEGLFELSGYDACLEQIRNLSEADLETQAGYIQGAVYARLTTEQSSATYEAHNSTGERDQLSPTSVQPLTRDQLIEAAWQIGEEVKQRAVVTRQSAFWLTFESTAKQLYRFKPMGPDLYAGASGMILFFAALEHTVGGYREWVNKAAYPLILQIEDNPRTLIKTIGQGGSGGTGSILYTLARVGKLLNESAFIDCARQLAQGIAPADIADDQSFDVMDGSAGTLLGLLALHAVCGDAAILDQAVACGQRLVAARQASTDGLRAWPTQKKLLLCGFGHGTAGIAYALLRLYAATQNADFLAAAQEAIQYEQTLYMPEYDNWRDLAGHPEFPVSGLNWCHGGVGISLARLAGLQIIDTPLIRRDIQTGLTLSLRFARNEVDQMCCGIMAKVETLLTASQVLQKDEPKEWAKRWATFAVERGRLNGGYRSFGNVPPSIRNWGFFQGYTGIGYELLRLAAPDDLPAVLTWDI